MLVTLLKSNLVKTAATSTAKSLQVVDSRPTNLQCSFYRQAHPQTAPPREFNRCTITLCLPRGNSQAGRPDFSFKRVSLRILASAERRLSTVPRSVPSHTFKLLSD